MKDLNTLPVNIFKDYPNTRYCKIKKGDKRPFEEKWQTKEIKYEEIKQHILSGGNYGVLTGHNGLIVIDCDLPTDEDKSTKDNKITLPKLNKLLVNHLLETLPETLRVRSGSGQDHLYFICKELPKKIVIKNNFNNIKTHWGEVQHKGQQIVGPGSLHPNGKTYDIINNEPIATISLSELYIALNDFINDEKEIKKDELDKKHKLNITDVFDISTLKKHTSGEYFGSHPVHGSSGGVNFWVNPDKNVWHCHRCNAGGGVMSGIAVQEQIIECSEAGTQLKGKKKSQLMSIAKEKYGISFNKQEFGFSRTTIEDLTQREDNRKSFIKDMFMSESLNMIFSPPKTMKSFFSVYTACCIATGRPMLNQKTKQASVMYIDFENGLFTLKERFEGFIKGEGFDQKELDKNLHLISFPTTFFEEDSYRKELTLKEEAKETIFNYVRDNKIEVIYIDTLRRLGNFDENDSRAINSIYAQLFAPLMKDFNCCIIFLHHTPKDQKKQYRGSGDILGMITTAYTVDKIEHKNILVIEKYESRDNPIDKLQINFEIENKILTDDEGDTKEIIDSIKFRRTDQETENETENEMFAEARNIFINDLELEKLYRNKELRDILLKTINTSERTLHKYINFCFTKNILLDNNESNSQKRRYYLNPQLKNKTLNIEHKSLTDTQTKNVISKYLHDKFKTLDQIELSKMKRTEENTEGLFDVEHFDIVLNDWNKKGWLNLTKAGFIMKTDLYVGENN